MRLLFDILTSLLDAGNQKKDAKIQIQSSQQQQISILGALGINGFLAYQYVLGTINCIINNNVVSSLQRKKYYINL
ncbi:unnamed protein product [Paramecium sonneborni]|uniref:Uncharacterized protein n=1 Tax=Paramecium sonneborni TaxID=65129 RepID=A0A8S1Q000_9CILI|nr:unnamed protein product [Paramecium sonneborni]